MRCEALTGMSLLLQPLVVRSVERPCQAVLLGHVQPGHGLACGSSSSSAVVVIVVVEVVAVVVVSSSPLDLPSSEYALAYQRRAPRRQRTSPRLFPVAASAAGGHRPYREDGAREDSWTAGTYGKSSCPPVGVGGCRVIGEVGDEGELGEVAVVGGKAKRERKKKVVPGLIFLISLFHFRPLLCLQFLIPPVSHRQNISNSHLASHPSPSTTHPTPPR